MNSLSSHNNSCTCRFTYHPKIRTMVEMMAKEPVEWGSLGQWAGFFAMSERDLARLIVKETGLSFRQWRQQLQLIMALQGLVGDTVQKVAHTLGYESTTAFITMGKGLGANARPIYCGINYCFPTISETVPAAISGPTGSRETAPRPKQCPPADYPATSCGWLPH